MSEPRLRMKCGGCSERLFYVEQPRALGEIEDPDFTVEGLVVHAYPKVKVDVYRPPGLSVDRTITAKCPRCPRHPSRKLSWLASIWADAMAESGGQSRHAAWMRFLDS